MFWSHCGIIQDEINWILFFCWWHLVFLRLAWKFVWSLSCETRKKLAKHLLTGTFLGDSIYFRINLILAFYRIKRGKKWQNIQWHPLNSSFFLNWCNAIPDKIAKSYQLWLRGFVSIILNPFLRVFAISAFLKVIHAPKNPNFRYPENNLPTYIISNPHNWDFP